MVELFGIEVGSIGYGMMGLTWRSVVPLEQEDCIHLLNTAFESGARFWNAGEFYGTPEKNSLHLLKEYFTRYPERASQVVLSIKGGLDPVKMTPDGSEKGVTRSIEQCIRVLDGTKKIDIFECARVDPEVPIEETIMALARFVKEGKIGGIGLSEVRAETIKRAHKVHKISIVEIELSLWTTDVLQNGIAETCHNLGIPMAAYAPLSRGALTGKFVTKNSELPESRRAYPKFQDENLENNLRLSKEIENMAKAKNCTPTQVALGWITSLGQHKGQIIIPIPGAEKEEWVRQNSTAVTLTKEEMQHIDNALQANRTRGDRYWAAFAKYCEEK